MIVVSHFVFWWCCWERCLKHPKSHIGIQLDWDLTATAIAYETLRNCLYLSLVCRLSTLAQNKDVLNSSSFLAKHWHLVAEVAEVVYKDLSAVSSLVSLLSPQGFPGRDGVEVSSDQIQLELSDCCSWITITSLLLSFLCIWIILVTNYISASGAKRIAWKAGMIITRHLTLTQLNFLTSCFPQVFCNILLHHVTKSVRFWH